MFSKKKKQEFNILDRINEAIEEIDKKPKKKNYFIQFMKIILVFVLVIFLLLIILSSILFIRFKDVYNSAISGKDSLEYSIEMIKKKDFSEANSSARDSEEFFKQTTKELEKINNYSVAKNINIFKTQLTEAIYLIDSLRVVSKAIHQITSVAVEVDDILSGNLGSSFLEFSTIEKQRILKLLQESSPELNGLKAEIDLSLMNLEKVNPDNLFAPVATKIKTVKIELAETISALSKVLLASEIIPELAGYPDTSTFLVLLQNNTELRATGGFIGTYGILELKNGDILRFDTHDIYHMDMPVEVSGNFEIIPPKPIEKYLNKNWYMRDANWFPDFPTSARQVEWFYHEENNLLTGKNKINNFDKEFNGVIAITPELVIKLLGMLGSVNVRGDEYTQDNFIDLLQYKVEQDFDKQNISSWQRKAVVGEILDELKTRLFNLKFKDWRWIADNIGDNFRRKDILIYFKNKYLQTLTENIGIAGELKDVPQDYLMVVDSNMAALKTDAVMKKDIKYNIIKRDDGYISRLRIDYENKGEKDYKTSNYKAYVRIYVPRGSKIIKVEGLNKNIEQVVEFEKTSFQTYINVKLKGKGGIYIEYKLPEYIQESIRKGEYNLYVQRQPGSVINSFELDARLSNKVKSYNPSGFNINSELIDGSQVKWLTDLETDKEFKIIF